MPIYEDRLDDSSSATRRPGALVFTADLRPRSTAPRRCSSPSARPRAAARARRSHLCLRRRRRECEGAHGLCRGRVTKSTVRSAPAAKVAERIARCATEAEFDIASIPNSCAKARQSATSGAPTASSWHRERARARGDAPRLPPAVPDRAPILFTKLETSELIKYAATRSCPKITFINEIADLCETLGADVHDVAKGIGLDGRIGSKFLHPGPGMAARAFPRTRWRWCARRRRPRRRCASSRRSPTSTSGAKTRDGARASSPPVAAASRARPSRCSASRFKPNTTTCRKPEPRHRAGAKAQGAKIKAHDPEGMEEAKKLPRGRRALQRPLRGDAGRRCRRHRHRM